VLYTELLYAIIPTLFPCFLLICYPYILLRSNVFIILYVVMPVHPLVYRISPYGQQMSDVSPCLP